MTQDATTESGADGSPRTLVPGELEFETWFDDEPSVLPDFAPPVVQSETPPPSSTRADPPYSLPALAFLTSLTVVVGVGAFASVMVYGFFG